MLKTQRDKATEVGVLMDNTYKMFCRNRRNGRQRVPYIGTRPIVAARSPSDRHGHPSALGFAHGAGLGNVQGSSSSSSFGARMMGVGDLPRYRPSPTHAHGDEEGDEEDDDSDYDHGGGEYKSSSGGGRVGGRGRTHWSERGSSSSSSSSQHAYGRDYRVIQTTRR